MGLAIVLYFEKLDVGDVPVTITWELFQRVGSLTRLAKAQQQPISTLASII